MTSQKPTGFLNYFNKFFCGLFSSCEMLRTIHTYILFEQNFINIYLRMPVSILQSNELKRLGSPEFCAYVRLFLIFCEGRVSRLVK